MWFAKPILYSCKANIIYPIKVTNINVRVYIPSTPNGCPELTSLFCYWNIYLRTITVLKCTKIGKQRGHLIIIRKAKVCRVKSNNGWWVFGVWKRGGGLKRVLGGQDKLQRSGAFLLLLNVQALKEVVWNQHGYFTGMLTQHLDYRQYINGFDDYFYDRFFCVWSFFSWILRH